MKKLLAIIVLFLAFAGTEAKAQSYKTGLGLQLSEYSQGLTIKHFIKRNAALEGVISSRFEGVNITGLYEVHGKAFNEPGFNWFIGGGAHVSFYERGYYYYRNHHYHDFYIEDYYYNRSKTVLGLDGILGLEYTFSGAPINLGVHWKPEINFVGYGNGFIANDFAFSARFTFK